MNTVSGYGSKSLKWMLMLAVITASAASLTACGKKGNLEKPGSTTEATKKKPA